MPTRTLDATDAILYDFVKLSPRDVEGYKQAVKEGGYSFWGRNPLPREQSVKYGFYKSLPFTIQSGQRIEVAIRSKYPASTGTSELPIFNSPISVRVWPMEWKDQFAWIDMDMTGIRDFGDSWEITLTQRHPQSVTGQYVVEISNECNVFFSRRSEVTIAGITMSGNKNDRVWIEYMVKYVSR